MNMKTFIQNRNYQKLSVVVEGPNQPGELAFVMHGLSGNKDERHIRSIVEAFLESDYVVVSFDTTNTFGESDGKYENATLTQYYNDLEDVIMWASQQSWYIEPFVLAGHSFGGISTALYAIRYPEKVAALAPISTVVSGDLTLQTPKYQQVDLDEWKRQGIWEFASSDGTKSLKWACMEDRMKYDLLPEVGKLTMPVLLIVGERDNSTPPAHQKILYDKLPGPKMFHVIPGAIHTFNEEHERNQLKRFVKEWVKGLE